MKYYSAINRNEVLIQKKRKEEICSECPAPGCGKHVHLAVQDAGGWGGGRGGGEWNCAGCCALIVQRFLWSPGSPSCPASYLDSISWKKPRVVELTGNGKMMSLMPQHPRPRPFCAFEALSEVKSPLNVNRDLSSIMDAKVCLETGKAVPESRRIPNHQQINNTNRKHFAPD